MASRNLTNNKLEATENGAEESLPSHSGEWIEASGGQAAPIRMRVNQMRYEAESVLSVELVPMEQSQLPAFSAGAHIDVDLGEGISRSYSLINSQSETSRYAIAVNRNPQSRGGSRLVHESLRVGDKVSIRPPRNNFPLNEDASHSILIAGGIGITPLLSMIRRLESLGQSWELHYAARTRGAAAFVDTLRALAGDRPERVHLYLSREPGGKRLDVGAFARRASRDADLYCCGPAAMLASFESETTSLPNSRVHIERFSSTESPSLEGGFEVILQRSNRRIQVPPGKTVLDALLDANINVAFSCGEGVCGTCETAVIAGEPDHRDEFLSNEEKRSNKTMMICCSGSHSAELVLDL